MERSPIIAILFLFKVKISYDLNPKFKCSIQRLLQFLEVRKIEKDKEKKVISNFYK